MFGSAQTYQLPPTEPPAGVEGGAADLGGRLIFAEDLDYDTFKSRLEEESIVSKTLTEPFDLDTFREQNGQNATLIASVENQGSTCAAATGDCGISTSVWDSTRTPGA